jgi:hypothetical protein
VALSFEQLRDFIQKPMQMDDQGANTGGKASIRNIARAFLSHDVSQRARTESTTSRSQRTCLARFLLSTALWSATDRIIGLLFMHHRYL